MGVIDSSSAGRAYASLEQVFAEACTAQGSSLFPANQLAPVLDYARERGFMVDALEAYELKGELECPRPDLSNYGGESEGARAGMTPAQELVYEYTAALQALALTEEEPAEFGFKIYVVKA